MTSHQALSTHSDVAAALVNRSNDFALPHPERLWSHDELITAGQDGALKVIITA